MSDYITRFRNKASVIQGVTSQVSDFIAASLSKIEVIVEGQVNAIPIVFINSDKEGVDEAIIYTYKGDGLTIGKYFTWEEWTYLVYKEVKNVKRENYIDSFLAVKCNINFEYNGSNVKAFFRGPMRLRSTSVFDEAAQQLGLDLNMRSIVIVPSSLNIPLLTEFSLDDTGWRVEMKDSFTTPGITYLNVALRNLVDTDKTSDNEPVIPSVPDEEPVTPIEELDAGITYIFDTEEAYIKTSVPINILERKLTSIKFIIPFGTTELKIETKQAGEIVTESYKVK